MIEMKGKCAFLDDFFLLQKRRRLQQVNLIEKNTGIACRVAASSNKPGAREPSAGAPGPVTRVVRHQNIMTRKLIYILILLFGTLVIYEAYAVTIGAWF